VAYFFGGHPVWDTALQIRIDSYSNSTIKVDIVQRHLVQAADIDKIVDRFSALGDSRSIVLKQGLSAKTEDCESMEECCALHTV